MFIHTYIRTYTPLYIYIYIYTYIYITGAGAGSIRNRRFKAGIAQSASARVSVAMQARAEWNPQRSRRQAVTRRNWARSTAFHLANDSPCGNTQDTVEHNTTN